MEIDEALAVEKILGSFHLQASDFSIHKIVSGHIHETFRLTGHDSFVLQRVNKNVFKEPEIIASNLEAASDYLTIHFPGYNFLRAIAADGRTLVYDDAGFPWRLFPARENTMTIDKVENPEEAYSAAEAFGGLISRLDGIDVSKFRETIPRFHDLSWRYRQFGEANTVAKKDRRVNAREAIRAIGDHRHLAGHYQKLVSEGTLRLRITHNDTKINNVLFDATTKKAVCVIDLDTLMPGYFIYDLGDMVRTFVSPVSEEEGDLSKVKFRKEIYSALLSGFLSPMEKILTPHEMGLIPIAGKMMTYIMALRFLTDYLSGDKYYHTTYEGQNLVRAKNQLRLLEIIPG